MPRSLRSEQFVASDVCIVHAVQRCVRRSHLAGKDPVSGKNFEPRREWIRRRLELLSAVFGMDVLTYAIMSNHLHVVLRNRPDVVKAWTDKEVAHRWLQLFPGRRIDEHLGTPIAEDVKSLTRDKQRMKRVRTRLSDISWFMRALCEPIARMANRQDDCTGRFWEGRFKAQRITDEAGLLACAMYVDLNPVRAAMAQTPETSRHTSAYDRIRALKGEQVTSAASEVEPITQEEAAETLQTTSLAARKTAAKARRRAGRRRIRRDAWLAPLTLSPGDETGPRPSKSSVRASDKGFLSIDLKDYLNLLDWTGRHGRKNKVGRIPAHLSPIFARLGIDSSMWCDLVWNFKRYFGRSAGSPSSLKADAASRGRSWAHGQRHAAGCFAAE